MRHQKAGRKLNRTGSHRDAMFRNMVTSLIAHGQIRTTDAKAKELRRWADRMVTLAKRGDLHARRQALSVVRDKAVVHKLFEEASERFGARAGGYTRIIKIGRRIGDGAPMSLVEFVKPDEKKKPRKKKAKAAKKATPKGKKETAVEAKEKKETKEKAEKVEAEAAEKEEPKPKKAEAEAGEKSEEAKAAKKTTKKADTEEKKETKKKTAAKPKNDEGADKASAKAEAKEEASEAKEEK
jgi:large subunit ribosomal protein L17